MVGKGSERRSLVSNRVGPLQVQLQVKFSRCVFNESLADVSEP